MGRPAKPVVAGTGKIGKQAKNDRENAEKSLKGNAKNVQPAYKLTTSQAKVFKAIRKVLQDAGVLGELDAYVLTATAVAFARVQEIDLIVNENERLLFDKDRLSARDKYWSAFCRGCNELGLSPQARAKLGIVAAGNKSRENDPLAKLLAGDDGDDE